MRDLASSDVDRRRPRCGDDKLAVQRLREAAETAKIELASKVQADNITPFQTGPKHLQVSLSRAQLEKLVEPLLMRGKGPCEACTKDAGLKNGGMTKMPIVTEVVRSVFGKDPSNSVNPNEVVALGAADPARSRRSKNIP